MIAFPTWLLVAVAGHVANGVAFIIDKSLLNNSFKRSATYAGLVGCLGILAAVLLPFGVHIPSNLGWIWIITTGITFVLALWAFFTALSMGEASRVVPIIGSLIPILTLAGTAAFLAERLTNGQLIGFSLLILATVILAGGKAKSRLNAKTITMAVAAAVLFAISSITVKLGYESDGFVTTFTISRFAGFATAIAALLIDRQALKEMKEAVLPSKKKKPGAQRIGKTALIMMLIGQGLGSAGFVLVQYAINLGSAAIVNALQAVQYALLVLAAFVLAKRAPKLLGEDLTFATVVQKTIALLFVAAGLWLVV